MSDLDVLGLGKGEINKDELKIALMKLMAEQNNEKFLEYDRATDTLVVSKIKDGEFQELEVMQDFVSTQDIATDRIHEADKILYRRKIQTFLNSPQDFSFEVRYNVPDLGYRWYRMFVLSIADETGYVTKFVMRMQNIQLEKEAQETMRNQEERDSLSGVYNHATYEHLCMELTERSSEGLLFVMVDIDNFKQINDTRGHHAGDKIIQHVGNVLETFVKGRGYAGRTGGDEFSVCFYDVHSREQAVSLCTNMKSAINQYVNLVPFTVSIGATLSTGRKLSYHELYFEADEAVYFSKSNGKNQIVFRDEIQEKKKQQLLESKSVYALSEEEFALDQRLDYIVIVDPVTKKLLYVNEAARTILGLTLEEIQQMYCYELFKSGCSACGMCELHTNHTEVLSEEDAEGLHKYIPNGKFILQSTHTLWKGDAARYITFIDVNDPAHVEICAEAMMESQETFSKCWSLILESNTGDTAYEKILRVLTDYYDADCSAIVTKDGEQYNELFEYHRYSAQGVSEGLRISLGQDILEQCEVLLDEDGFMRPRHINEKLMEFPDLAEALERKFVRNTMGIALRKFGEIIAVLMIINPRHNTSDYNMISRIGVFFSTDLVRKKLTDSKTYEEEHDVMTRLWNRGFFNNAWQIDYLPLFKNGMGVFSADIFRLKDINKQLGYNAGSDRIVEVADLFRKVFAGYSIFRYDDDQILAVCHNVDQKHFQNMVDYAKDLVAELEFEVSYGYSWKAEPLVHDAISEAEEYQAIHRQYLEKEHVAAKKLAKKIEKDVMKQIEDGNFRMYLQPKVSISTRKTVGAEALIRLYHPEKGMISPAMFIPVLEKQNEVHIIDMFILRRALEFQKEAKEAGLERVPISVNFSKNTLMYPKLMEYIQDQCDIYGSPNGLIRIEITETISNMDHIEVRNIAKALNKMGFLISMDDFGTQYSNMAVLTQFDFDTVKIDRSMIINIVDDAKNRIILKHTIGMLKELGMETIIEGVETAEQVEVLESLGCDIVQGFFFGRPEPEEKFYELFM